MGNRPTPNTEEKTMPVENYRDRLLHLDWDEVDKVHDLSNAASRAQLFKLCTSSKRMDKARECHMLNIRLMQLAREAMPLGQDERARSATTIENLLRQVVEIDVTEQMRLLT